jgi:hypothetical protein
MRMAAVGSRLLATFRVTRFPPRAFFKTLFFVEGAEIFLLFFTRGMYVGAARPRGNEREKSRDLPFSYYIPISAHIFNGKLWITTVPCYIGEAKMNYPAQRRALKPQARMLISSAAGSGCSPKASA